MVDKIIALYREKPTIFWIFGIVLIPALVLFTFKGFALSFLANKVNSTNKDAELKDKAFKTAIDSLSAQGDKAKQAADELGKEAADVSADPDWNKKV